MAENPFALRLIMGIARRAFVEDQASAFRSEKETRRVCAQYSVMIAQSRQLLNDLADFP